MLRNWTSSENVECQTIQKVEIFGHFMNCIQQHFLSNYFYNKIELKGSSSNITKKIDKKKNNKNNMAQK